MVFLNSGCVQGPQYVKPDVSQAPLFKEAEGWKIAEPNDEHLPSDWWSVYQDETLNHLESQISLSNQNLKAAEARFRQAQALTTAARADLYPTLTGTVSHTRNQPSANSTNSINGSKIRTTNVATLGLSWEADVWGRVRRNIESNQATAEASQGDSAALTLSLQAELAQHYVLLRVADQQKQMLDDTIKLLEKSLQVTQNRYEAGVVGKSDVLQAQTLLQSTQVQVRDIQIQRSQAEHAIAVLIGTPPSALSIPVVTDHLTMPSIPLSLPSTVLERRPDVAATERRVAAANAQIGVAKAAYFPVISLSSLAGFQSNEWGNLVSWPSRVWSLGSNLAITVFDAGKRSALNDQAVAAYDEQVANYRQTVLTAFQEVEDSLVALNVLQNEIDLQQNALSTSQQAQKYTDNQYKAGVVTYLDVATMTSTSINNQRTLITLKGNQLVQSINLIKALGGGM